MSIKERKQQKVTVTNRPKVRKKGKRAKTQDTKHPPLRKNVEKIPQRVGKTGDEAKKFTKNICA